MKFEAFSETFPLTGVSIDRISEHIESFLGALQMEGANILRIRLSLEEALLRWQDHFGNEVSVKLDLGVHWKRPTITLGLAGERYDPFVNSENDLGQWSNSLLSAIGLSPRYSYQQGTNIVQLKLQRPQMKPAFSLLLSVTLGILIGVLGDHLLPEQVQEAVLRTVLDPLQNTFFRVLGGVGGPVIFFSVLVAICGVGSIAEMNQSGRRIIARFILLSAVMTLISILIIFPFFPLNYRRIALDGTQFSSVLDLFFQIFPGNILSPFIEGDSPQLILIAIVLGNALLLVGVQGQSLIELVGQCNSVCLIIAGWTGRLAPFFVALLLILRIWNGSMQLILGIWKPLVFFLLLTALMLTVRLLRVSLGKKVPVKILIGKMRESFLIALRAASVDASFGVNQSCCEHRLGIPRRLTDFGLPLGMVTYMPTATIAVTIFAFYSAQAYGIPVSSLWYLATFFLAVTLQAATPPMPGVSLLTFVVLFSRIGIPTGALVVAIVADALIRFITAPADQAMLQLELLLEADRINMLDRKKLNR